MVLKSSIRTSDLPWRQRFHRGLRVTQHAYFSLLTHTKQLLLVTLCDMLACIEVSFWADGTGRMEPDGRNRTDGTGRTEPDGQNHRRTDGWTDRRGSRNSCLDMHNSMYVLLIWWTCINLGPTLICSQYFLYMVDSTSCQ